MSDETTAKTADGAVIKSVAPGSPAARAGVRAGDALLRINGSVISDVLDYEFHSYDKRLLLELRRSGGGRYFARVNKPDGTPLGLEFETYLIDAERGCRNRCIFCFIDQLPRGMRKTLYCKDDDARLSFLQGNYITLTNMPERELRRVIDLRVSPLRVSVHTMNPELRAFMLGNPDGADGVEALRKLAGAGITLECQIVVCPGVNDGAELDYSMRELEKLYPNVGSVSVVPVGLTRYRDGLHPLEPVTREHAWRVIFQVEAFAKICRAKHGSRIFYCADELYIKAGRELPPDAAYEGYPQLDNGVGMMRLLITEFEDAMNSGQWSVVSDRYGDDGRSAEVELHGSPHSDYSPLFTNRYSPAADHFTIVTGTAAAPFIEKLLCTAREKYGKIDGEVLAVENKFFGESVTVAGLLTGGDIIAALERNAPKGRILLPRNMLRHGEDTFLDDVTVRDIEARFGVTARVVERDGADLLRAMLGIEGK